MGKQVTLLGQRRPTTAKIKDGNHLSTQRALLGLLPQVNRRDITGGRLSTDVARDREGGRW